MECPFIAHTSEQLREHYEAWFVDSFIRLRKRVEEQKKSYFTHRNKWVVDSCVILDQLIGAGEEQRCEKNRNRIGFVFRQQ